MFRFLPIILAPATALATPWFSGDAQPDATIRALALSPSGNSLYVGGDFTSIGSQPIAHLAQFDLRTETWAPVPGADTLAAPIHSLLATSDGTLFVGGAFPTISSTTPAQRLAALDTITGTWSALTDVNFPAAAQNGPPFGTVRALFRTQETLVIGGDGFSPAFAATDTIILYNFGVSRYAPLSNGLAGGPVNALTFAGEFGIAAGSFTTTGNGARTLNGFGAWRANTGWGNPSGALDAPAHALLADGDTAIVAGEFTGRVLTTTAGSPFAPLATGLPAGDAIFALAAAPDGRIYATGNTSPPLAWKDTTSTTWTPSEPDPNTHTYRSLALAGETLFLGGDGFSRFLPGGDLSTYVPGAALLNSTLTLQPDLTLRFSAREGSTYTLETSTDLTTWDTGSSLTAHSAGNELSFPLPTGTRTFARIRISSP